MARGRWTDGCGRSVAWRLRYGWSVLADGRAKGEVRSAEASRRRGAPSTSGVAWRSAARYPVLRPRTAHIVPGAVSLAGGRNLQGVAEAGADKGKATNMVGGGSAARSQAQAALKRLATELRSSRPQGWSLVVRARQYDEELVVRPADRSIGKFGIAWFTGRLHVAFFSRALNSWNKRAHFNDGPNVAIELWEWMLAEAQEPTRRTDDGNESGQ